MMAEDAETMEDYTLHGWQMSEFGSRKGLEDWAYDHLSKAEYEEAKANILQHGQTAVLRVNDDKKTAL